MLTRLFVLSSALFLPLSGFAQFAPVVLYSDLTDGPSAGGENSKGAIVTLYGRNFGNLQGLSTVSVGGGIVDNYRIWSDTKIAFQLGPLAKTGSMVVTVNGVSSAGIPFTVRPGNIYFVSATGSDTNGSGSFARPWGTIVKCKNQLATGDICYVMNGVTQTAIDNYDAALAIIADAGGSGTPGYSKALVAYPGAVVQLGTSSVEFAVRFSNIHGPVAYWTIAGFNLVGDYTALGIDGATNLRLVANNMQCPNGNGSTACVETSLAAYLGLLGNEITNAGVVGSSKLYHTVYFSTDTNHVEVGWNNIHDNNSCRGIQFHSTPLSATTGYNQYDLNVHDNIIHGQVCDGINFATVDPSQGAVRAYNNIIYQVGRGPDPPEGPAVYTGIYVAGGTNNGSPGSGIVEVDNNTFYDCGSRGGSDAGAFERPASSPALLLSLKNNIIYQKSGESYLAGSTTSSLVTGANNLWYGAGPGPSWLTNTITADPLFVNLPNFDFHLQSGSPAIDAGTIVSVASDFDGVPRPQGMGYDIGAYEMPQGASTIPAIASVAVALSSIVGGNTVVGNQVALTAPAPVGGVSVQLASTNAAASVLSIITVPPGATSAAFTIATSAVSASTPVTISATLGNVTRTATLSLLPAGAASPAPIISPASGFYTVPQTITITSSVPSSAIRYTTDGSIPNDTSALYSGPFLLSGSATINAIATVSGSMDSPAGTAVYVLTAQGWYSGWSNRKAVIISHTQVSGSSSLTNFPLLVSVTDANLQSIAKSDGRDILFTAGDGLTKLNHEIELYSNANGQLVAWVNIPSLSPATDTVIYMYYGNPAAANQQNPVGVWDSNFAGVWHFAGGSGLNAKDSTSNGNNGTVTGATVGSGLFGAGASFSGGAQQIDLGATPGSLQFQVPWSWSGWVYVTNAASCNHCAVYGSYRAGSGHSAQNEVRIEASNGQVFFQSSSAGGSINYGYGGSAIPAKTWTHVAVTVSGTAASPTVSFYKNGSLTSTQTFGSMDASPDWSVHVQMGHDAYGDNFWGQLDEARVSKVARSASQIATEYNNQNSPGSFLSFGTQEGSGGSTVAITVASAPAGLSLLVDGTACTSPCAFQWNPGASHTIAAATQVGAGGTQYVFANWSGSGAASRSVTVPATTTTYIAAFTTQYMLTTSASPAAGGSIAPASGWVNAGTVVAVSATANAGYKFTGFSGSLSDTTSPQILTVNAPATVTANFSATTSAAWYGAGGTWSNRKAVIIGHTQVSGVSNLTNFPLLVSVTDANLQSIAKSDGRDILFTASDGLTKLNHEIELYSNANGQLVAWVNVPSVSPTVDTVIYMYYGNPASANQQNPASVWDSSFAGVWHFAGGSSLSATDSTSNANNGTVTGATVGSGQIGAAASFQAGTQRIDLGPTPASLQFQTPWTWSGWVNPTSLAACNHCALYGAYDRGTNKAENEVRIEAGTGRVFFQSSTASGSLQYYYGDTVPLNTWTHIVVTVSGTSSSPTLQFYKNGTLTNTYAVASLDRTPDYTVDVEIGQDMYGDSYFGRLDEVRVSNVARSAAQIAADYTSQSSPATFITVAAQESHP